MIPSSVTSPTWQSLKSLYYKHLPELDFDFKWMQEKPWNKFGLYSNVRAYIYGQK